MTKTIERIAREINDYSSGSNWTELHVLDLVHALASEPGLERALTAHVRELRDDLRRTGGV